MTKIAIPEEEYNELKRKAAAYDSMTSKMSTAGSKGGRKSSASLTPEQRRERAKKAVAARIAKYGQQKRK